MLQRVEWRSLCCAAHLGNREGGFDTHLVEDREAGALAGEQRDRHCGGVTDLSECAWSTSGDWLVLCVI